MQASFIICFHSARLDNLSQTLRFLVSDHVEVISISEIVLVCQDKLEENKIEELEKLYSKFLSKSYFQMNLDEMSLPKITNFGVSCAKSDRIIILESDRLLPKGYFAKVLQELKPKISITTKFMEKLLAPVTDNDINDKKYTFKEEFRSETNQIGMRNMWSGNTAIMKSDYLEAGMMDENYVGYGWADSDMCNRMNKIGVKNQFWDDVELHLWHPSTTYGNADQKRLFINNGLRFCQIWNVPKPEWFLEEIANHKDFKYWI